MLARAEADVALGTAYVAVAVVLVIGWRLDDPKAADHWRRFWLVSVVAVVAMACSRLGGLATWITESLRDAARDAGWYRSRRPVQAAAVGALMCAWLLVGWAVRRWFVGRRRYGAMFAAMLAIGAFATVRLVSLHQVDAVLRRRPIADVRLASVIEGVLLWLLVLAAWFTPVFRAPAVAPADPSPAAGSVAWPADSAVPSNLAPAPNGPAADVSDQGGRGQCGCDRTT